MENYSGMIIWAIVAVIGIVIVAKIVKKIAGVLLLVAILLFSGSIPYSTVNSIVDTATGGYEQITQQAALWHIDENTVSGEKVLYLTFDCGYENGCTEKILDVLKEKKVPAAFFVTLPYLKSAPETTARMILEGHVVGNHSDTHPNFSTITRTQMAKEIENVENYLRTHFGYSSCYFRFPQGAYSESALDLVNNAGYKSVFWSSAYADWDTNNLKGKDYAFNTVTSRLHPGCVLLLHAVSQDNADALGEIIDYARGQGYEFRQLP